MKNKKAFELREFMFIYNIFQVIFCTYITYEVRQKKPRRSISNKILFYKQATYVWIKEGYSLLCQPVDFSESSIAMRVS